MRKFFLAALFFILVCVFPFSATAQTTVELATQPHFTIIVNQVRGKECCSAGGLSELNSQLQTVEKLKLPATFTLRYDALRATDLTSRLKSAAARQSLEIGAFLEITPSLASASGVVYTGNDENWYHAEHAYFIGYEPADRIKMIDTYMAEFKKVFVYYPTTTTAWMIDTPSLKYLNEKYGVQVHELTREQWGTDSYSLYGGPPHYPYYPSANWAMIPRNLAAESEEKSADHMPLIVRQTITDPVWNYGDTTNSYTSQPNDYGNKNRGFSYFEQLFTQAHAQPENPYTFALLGLENSMPEKDQQEFAKQLEYLANWRQQNTAQNQVVTGSAFAKWFAQQKPDEINFSIYQGQDGSDASSKAWWITTPGYRARVRAEQNQLYISDFRLYDSQWQDPYTTHAAKKNGYWVVPFLVDGSRFWQKGTLDDWPTLAVDSLSKRQKKQLTPTRLQVSNKVESKNLQVTINDGQLQLKNGDQEILSFNNDSFTSATKPELIADHPLLTPYLSLRNESWEWHDLAQNVLWYADVSYKNGQWNIHPSVVEHHFLQPVTIQAAIFFPELKTDTLSANKTKLVVSNRYAMAGRNPARLVFYPRDQYGLPIELSDPIDVTTEPNLKDHIELTKANPGNGMTFIDINDPTVETVTVTVKTSGYTKQEKVYFVSNCSAVKTYCLTHPLAAWRYLRNRVGDELRDRQRQADEVTN